MDDRQYIWQRMIAKSTYFLILGNYCKRKWTTFVQQALLKKTYKIGIEEIK